MEINADPNAIISAARKAKQVEGNLRQASKDLNRLEKLLSDGWQSADSALLTEKISKRVKKLNKNVANAKILSEQLNSIADKIRRVEREIALQNK